MFLWAWWDWSGWQRCGADDLGLSNIAMHPLPGLPRFAGEEPWAHWGGVVGWVARLGGNTQMNRHPS